MDWPKEGSYTPYKSIQSPISLLTSFIRRYINYTYNYLQGSAY
jgi:hypothetical protein